MDWENYFRFVLALTFVLGLIGLLALVVRRYGIGMGQVTMRKGTQRRLQLVEVMPLDAKRRAVLIRRDEVEHLVILGPESETVVETHIAADPSPAETSSSDEDDRVDFANVLDSTQTANKPEATT